MSRNLKTKTMTAEQVIQHIEIFGELPTKGWKNRPNELGYLKPRSTGNRFSFFYVSETVKDFKCGVCISSGNGGNPYNPNDPVFIPFGISVDMESIHSYYQKS